MPAEGPRGARRLDADGAPGRPVFADGQRHPEPRRRGVRPADAADPARSLYEIRNGLPAAASGRPPRRRCRSRSRRCRRRKERRPRSRAARPLLATRLRRRWRRSRRGRQALRRQGRGHGQARPDPGQRQARIRSQQRSRARPRSRSPSRSTDRARSRGCRPRRRATCKPMPHAGPGRCRRPRATREGHDVMRDPRQDMMPASFRGARFPRREGRDRLDRAARRPSRVRQGGDARDRGHGPDGAGVPQSPPTSRANTAIADNPRPWRGRSRARVWGPSSCRYRARPRSGRADVDGLHKDKLGWVALELELVEAGDDGAGFPRDEPRRPDRRERARRALGRGRRRARHLRRA